jgi:hypothetical protein
VRLRGAHTALHLGIGEVLVAVVDCFGVAAINGHDGVREQVQLAA